MPAGFTIGAVASVVAYGAMVVLDRRTGTLRAATTPTTIGLFLTAFVGYLLVAWANERHRLPLRWLWAVPVVSRLLLLATEPTLSDDVYRYLWDGHVLTNGINPYRYAVAAPALDGIEIPIRELVNNPDLSTPYLPTAQLVFALLALTLPTSALAVQAVMAALDVAVAVVLWRLLPQAGFPARRAMLYLWHPLVIVEAAHGAHFDSLMTVLACTALLVAVAPRAPSTALAAGPGRGERWRRLLDQAVSPIALALAALTRVLPVLFAPVLWWRWTWSQRALSVATTVLLLLPFGLGSAGWGLGGAADGTGVFGSARVYAAEFRFNAVPATWLERWLGGPADVVTGVTMLALLTWTWWRARSANGADPADVRRQLRLLAVPLLGYVVLTPVLHPWYLTMVIATTIALAPTPDEPVQRWWLLAPWWYLSGAVSLSYLTYLDPDAFGELDWVRRVEWWPTLLGLALVAAATARARWVRPSPRC